MKKTLKVFALLLVVAIFSFFVFSLFASNDIYKIDSASINYTVDKSGIVSVEKIYNIRMLKPYRFITLYEYLKFGKFVATPSILSSKPVKLYYNFSDKKFTAKLLFSKDMNNRIIPSPKGDIIRLVVSYKLNGVVEVGKDYKLLSMKVWNEDIDTSVDKITFTYKGPSPRNVKVYSSTPYKKVSSTTNSFSYTFSNVHPKQPIVFDAYFGDDLQPVDYYSSLKYRKDIEVKTYESAIALRFFWYILFPILMIIVYIYLFKLFGKEYATDNIEYFRDIPYNDSPIVVNSIIKLSLQKPDEDGVNSLILQMVKEGSIEFLKDEKSKIIGFKVSSSPKNDVAKKFLDIFKTDRVIFKELQREFKNDYSAAKTFYDDFNLFKDYVLYKAESKKLFSKKGYILSITFGIVAVLTSVLMIFDFSVHYKEVVSLLDLMKFSSVATFFMGILPFFLNPVIFGKWTKDGIVYYKKWKALENFLSDYSLIKERPPESITVWNDYLIYATALGIANKVRKNIEKLRVPDIIDSDIYYGSRGYYLGSLYSIYYMGAPKSSSGTGGGGFGGTSSGGGFGGGGMSAG